MYKSVFALALALLMLALCLPLAAADVQNTVYPVDAERINYTAPKGIAIKSIEKEDGMLSVVIDAEKTDWEKVLLYGYDATIGIVINPLGFDAPEGAYSCLTTGMSYDPEFDTEDWVLEILNELTVYDTPSPRSEARNGTEILRYVEATGLVQPLDSRNAAIVASWFKEDGTLLRHEMLRYEITYTSTASLYQTLSKMNKSRIIGTGIVFEQDPTWDYASLGNTSALSTQVTDGAVRYQVSSVAEIGGYENLYTLVSAPQGANDGWTVSTGMSGEELWSQSVYLTGETVAGITLSRPAFMIGLYHKQADGVSECAYTVEWRDENGEIADVSQLTIQTVVGDPLPTPYYTDWEPVPAERLVFMDTNLGSLSVGTTPGKAVSGVEFSVLREGWMHLGVDDDNLPSGKQLMEANFTPLLIPPQGATHYKQNNSGGGNIFGADRAEEFVRTQEEITGNREEARPIPEDGYVELMSLDPVHPFENNGLTVFLPVELAGEYSGGIQTIFWYASDDPDAEPIKREFLINTQDADRFARVEETRALVNAPAQRVELPVIVVSGDLANRTLMLVIEIYPQTSETAVYYELYLKDDSGNRVALGGQNCQLYLPYPEGMDQFSEDVEFVIYHYTEYTNNPHDLSVAETFSEQEEGSMRLERTESGLLITVDSLSPFVLSWGDDSGHGGGMGGEDCGVGNHKLFYEDHGGALEERCEHCDHLSVALIELPNDWITVGEDLNAELILLERRWLGENQDGTLPELFYIWGDGVTHTFPPSEPGEYAIFIQQGGVRTYRDFAIVEEGMGGGDPVLCEPGEHELAYNDCGGIMEEICTRCDHLSVIILDVPEIIPAGEEVFVDMILVEMEWLGENQDGELPKLRFLDGEGNEMDVLPSEPGVYAAFIEQGGVRTSRDFAIEEGGMGGEGGNGCENAHRLCYQVRNGLLEELCENGDHYAAYALEMKDTFAEGEEILSELIAVEGEWLGEIPERRFYDKNMMPLFKAPTAPGSYILCAEMGDAQLVHSFSIVGKEVPVPQTGDSSLPVALLACISAASIGAALSLKKRKR